MASLSPMPSTSAGQMKSLNFDTMSSKGFKKLLDSQSLVDVTLACDGGQISAHKVVLSACSSYLHKILKTHPVKHPIIILPELNIKDIKILVNYMYTGELLTMNAFSPSLLRTAAVLNINSLNDFFNESSSNANSPSSSSPKLTTTNTISNNITTTNNNSPTGGAAASTTTSIKYDSKYQLESIKNSLLNGNNNNNINNSYNHDDIGALDDFRGHDHTCKTPKMERKLTPKQASSSAKNMTKNNYNNNNNQNSTNNNSMINNKNINKNAGNTSMSNINNLNISNLDEFLGTTGSYINHLGDDDFDDDDDDDDDQYNQDALMDESSDIPLDDYSREDDMMLANDSIGQYNLANIHARNQRSPPSKNGTHLDMQFDADKEIRCHLCDIKLSDVKCLYRHVLTRHLPDRWGYRCEFCDREFSRDDHLMRHYTTKHKGMEFNREKIRETRRHNREMAKNFHDRHATV